MRPQHRDRIRLLRNVRVVLTQYLGLLAHLDQARDRSYGHAGPRDNWLASHHGRIALHTAVPQTRVGLGTLDRLRDILSHRHAQRLRQLKLGSDGLRLRSRQPPAKAPIRLGRKRDIDLAQQNEQQ